VGEIKNRNTMYFLNTNILLLADCCPKNPETICTKQIGHHIAGLSQPIFFFCWDGCTYVSSFRHTYKQEDYHRLC